MGETEEVRGASAFAQTVVVPGPAGPVELSGVEGALWAYLCRHRGRVVPREELLTEVWGYSERARTRAIDMTVARVRQKIECNPREPTRIRSVYGQGYVSDETAG